MKNLISIFLLFVFGVTWGQETIEINNVFWKISNPENEATSFLFGTIHMIDKDKYVLPEMVENKLKTSKKLYLELDDLSDKSTAMKLVKLDSGRMTDILTDSQKDSVYSFVKDEFKMDSASFEKRFGKFKPFFFTQLAMMKVMFRSESYDKTFNKLADKSNIPIIGLETMEQQVSFFDAMPETMKVDMVMSSIRNHETFDVDWEKMQNLYVNQEIETLVNSEKSSPEMKDFMENVMMKNRNVKWVLNLDEDLKEGNLFIGVGAAHLVGDYGLVKLLTDKGYILEPIEIDLTK